MVDTAIRLLSLANQLSLCGKAVALVFEDGMIGTMGYLVRMGFFDYLAPAVDVLPERPQKSAMAAYRGLNTDLVEISNITPGRKDQSLPTRLADAVKFAVRARDDHNRIGNAAYTVFAELIDNVFQHSATALDGYAALQTYKAGGLVKVAVSDSGKGIMETLRPALQAESPSLNRLSDANLLLEIFKKGVSRHGKSRGAGLRICAAVALKYGSSIEVRLPCSCITFSPSDGKYTVKGSQTVENLPLLWGTHISIDFPLDW